MTDASFSIYEADWERDADELRHIRETVFVREQKVPLALEWDGQDAAASHVLARDATGKAIGCGRLLNNGHIGRMAVLADWRHQGVGGHLLRHLLTLAEQRGIQQTFLNAQTSAVTFYECFGFMAEGEEFMDAGIPHRYMKSAPPRLTK